MKDIFHKFRQGLSSLATDLPARQETLASAKDKKGRRTRVAARSGFGAGSGTVNAQELRFHGADEGEPGRGFTPSSASASSYLWPPEPTFTSHRWNSASFAVPSLAKV
jgi:hypothetical protein